MHDPRPVLVDLFCKAGGATKGYQRAGFYVIGVDIEPQPNYCGDQFILADAIEFLGRMIAGGTMEWVGPGIIDAFHASPPCQRWAPLTHLLGDADDHPDLIALVREALVELGMPYVIENVPRAPLVEPVVLCGSMFGLAVEEGELRRHRLFECSFPIEAPRCRHPRGGRPVLGIYGGGTRHAPRRSKSGGSTAKANKVQAAALMGIDWMTREEMCQAIPPAYAEFVGVQLMQAIGERG